MAPMLTLTRAYTLSALHTLAGEGFTVEENRKVFGGCSRLHGHDYRIEVTVRAPLDPVSHWLTSREELDRVVSEHLLHPLSGTNLSDTFRHTTGEALCLEFAALLEGRLPQPLRLVRLRVHETAKNAFST